MRLAISVPAWGTARSVCIAKTFRETPLRKGGFFQILPILITCYSNQVTTLILNKQSLYAKSISKHRIFGNALSWCILAGIMNYGLSLIRCKG